MSWLLLILNVEYDNGADKILLWLTATHELWYMCCRTKRDEFHKKEVLFRVNSYTESRQINIQHINDKSISHNLNSIMAVRSHTLEYFIYIPLPYYDVGRVAQSVYGLTTGWTIRELNPGGARSSARPDRS